MTTAPPLPEALWSRLPEDVREAVALVLRSQQARIAELEARVQSLQAQLARNSSNSSTPPSADPPSAPAPVARRPSKRKRGGQKGHKGHSRDRLPADQLTHVIALVPDRCDGCGHPLPQQAQPADPPPTWHQVVELPRRPAVVTEYQGHFRACPCCQVVSHHPIPAEIKADAFGPRLAAGLNLLAGCQHVSVRGLQEAAGALLGVDISAGTLVRLQQQMSQALEAPAAALAREVKQAPVKHVDETGWSNAGCRRWLWVAVTATAVYFLVHLKRGRDALHELLGGEPLGVIVSDRWSAYLGVPPPRRQVCWAHLKRDFKAMEQAKGEAGPIGQQLLTQVALLFLFWRMFKAGKRKRPWLQRQVEQLIRPDVQTLLESGRGCSHAPTASKCAGIEELEECLWAFAYQEGVEPTNNAAERALRPAVVRRKKSFGSASAEGETWLGRLLSVTQTLKKRGLAVLQYLADALSAFRNGLDAPTLPQSA
jgi:transposase